MGTCTGASCCPNGSTLQPGWLGTEVINIFDPVGIAAVFSAGVPAKIAGLIAGLVPLVFVSSDFCQLTPLSPGPFDMAWLNPSNLLDTVGFIEQWITSQVQVYWWNQYCMCNATPPSSPSLFASFGFNCGTNGANLELGSVPPGAYSWYLNTTVQQCSGAFGGCSFVKLNWYAGGCTGSTVAGNDIMNSVGCGPTCSPAHACPNTGVTGPVGASSSTEQCVRLVQQRGTGPATYSIQGLVRYLPAAALAIGIDQIPPSQPNHGPSVVPPNTPTFPAPTSTGSACNLAPIAANLLEVELAPQGRIANGGHVAVSGTGAKLVPGGAVGATLTLTAYPPEYNHDLGDPPRLYQIGWWARSIDGVETSGPQVLITSGQQQMWPLLPTDAFIVFNLYPGFAGNIQFWGAPTPS